jgi:hypothetical protein
MFNSIHGVLMYLQVTLINKWILTLLCLSLTACGGSKKIELPAALKDTTPPSIESSLPDEESSSNFEVDFNFELIFSELMDSDSLIAEEGVKLFSRKATQDSVAELELRPSSITISVVPLTAENIISGKEEQIPATKILLTHASGRFALNTTYSVEVDSPARDIVKDDISTSVDERNYISSSSAFEFTTEKGEWKSELAVPNILVENEGLPQETTFINVKNQFSPTIISNKIGDSFVLWRQEVSPGIIQLWGSRYNVNEEKWVLIDKNKQLCTNSVCANAHQINVDDSTSVLEYDAAINDSGQLAIVWSQAENVGGFVSIKANLYDGDKWLGVKDISYTGFTRTDNADSPQVEIDQKGNVISIWRENENQYSRIKTDIFKTEALMTDGEWTEAPYYIDNLSQVFSKPPKLSLNNKGLAIAVWAQKSERYYHIYSNHLRLNQSESQGWNGLERIDLIDNSLSEYEVGDSTLPKIEVDSNDDAIAIWLKHDGQRNNLWYSRFSGSWSVADSVESDRRGDAAFPIITFNQQNKALVVWTQENKTTKVKELLSSFFDVLVETGWDKQTVIASGANLSKPVATFDREGNAVIMWQDGLSKGTLNTSYYSKITESWEYPEISNMIGNDLSVAPLFEDGRFLSVWVAENDFSFKLNSALYSD